MIQSFWWERFEQSNQQKCPQTPKAFVSEKTTHLRKHHSAGFLIKG
jgi:hypothetical protein